MATETADLLDVPAMAAKLGITESAVRQAVNRKADWLPPPFKLGSRLKWRREDVDEFLAKKAQQTDGRRTRGNH